MARSKCLKSRNPPFASRLIPLDVASAAELGWSDRGGGLALRPEDGADAVAEADVPAASGGDRILDVPDVPDNRNRIPFQFRYAHYREGTTEAYYTNDVDGQASVLWTTDRDINCRP